MSSHIGLVLDGVILVFLAVTIFYAARLSLFMKSFRDSRQAIQSLIRDLSTTIAKSEAAILTMKADALGVQKDVVEVLKEAKFIADELKYMSNAGDSLADRLSLLADRNKELVDLIEKSGGIGRSALLMEKVMETATEKAKPVRQPRMKEPIKHVEAPFEIEDFDLDEDDEIDFQALEDGAYRASQIKETSKNNPSSKSDGFVIFDRDFIRPSAEDDQEEKNDSEDFVILNQGHNKPVKSKAEQDLYNALQRRKRIDAEY